MQTMNLSMIPYTQAGNFVCSQYDVGRECQIDLIDDNGAYTIPTGSTITLLATKPSGFGFSVACTWSGSTVTFATTETMTSEFGRFPAELRIVKDDILLGTTNFYFKVERSPHPEGTTDGDAETIISDITLLVQRAETAATTASASATAAATSESNASTSETNAAASATAAATSATNAAASEARVITAEDSLTEQINDLKEDLNDFKDGYGNLNLFPSAELYEENYYISIVDGHRTHAANNDFNIYFLKVDGSKIYTFSDNVRFLLPLASDKYTATSNILIQNVTQIDVSQYPNTEYLGFSFNKTNIPISSFGVSEGTTYQSGYSLPEWFNSEIDLINTDLEKMNDSLYDIASNSGSNLFEFAELLSDTGYASVSGGNLVIVSNSDYSAYLLPVDGASKYTFTTVRFGLLVGADEETVIGSILTNVTEIDSTGASYIAFSFNHNTTSTDTYTVYKKIEVLEKPKYAIITGDIASGGNLQLTQAKTNLRKNERIIFEGNITSFTSLKIGLTNATTMADATLINSFLIDNTNVSYYARNTSTPVVVAHGLTITNNIQIIWEMTAVASLKFTLISNGNMFTHEFSFSRQSIGNPYVLSISTVLTNCKLTWTCEDINKPIWIFGDSYIQYQSVRWAYYLHEYGYDNNVLLDGFAGEGDVNGRVSFNNLLTYGTPKYAVWCLGMNDGSDSDSAPSSTWVSARDYFLAYCSNNNVTPIFGTIPTVPTINHEQKNAWIRLSGYRYIDFAKAVGASASGTWYGDMLSSDGVHPSESGAKALFAQVLIDLPEIMVDEF